MVIFMQKEITVKDIEATLDSDEIISDPIVVKRANKRDVIIIDMEEYQDQLLDLDVMDHLRKSEEDRKNGRVKNARVAVKELMAKYGT